MWNEINDNDEISQNDSDKISATETVGSNFFGYNSELICKEYLAAI